MNVCATVLQNSVYVGFKKLSTICMIVSICMIFLSSKIQLSKAGMNELERSYVGGSLKMCGIWTKWEAFGKIAQEKSK